MLLHSIISGRLFSLACRNAARKIWSAFLLFLLFVSGCCYTWIHTNSPTLFIHILSNTGFILGQSWFVFMMSRIHQSHRVCVSGTEVWQNNLIYIALTSAFSPLNFVLFYVTSLLSFLALFYTTKFFSGKRITDFTGVTILYLLLFYGTAAVWKTKLCNDQLISKLLAYLSNTDFISGLKYRLLFMIFPSSL